MTTTYTGTPTSPESVLELRIIGTLCAHLKRAGWLPTHADTGDEDVNRGWVVVSTPKAVKEEFASVGTASVEFTNPTGERQYVRLIGGNGIDVICDWTYTDGDGNGFGALMNQITDYVQEAYDR